MQEDFHYYATYCAAYLAGYSHEESLETGYASQLVDLCSRTFLNKVHGPLSAATTQLQAELADEGSDIISLQDITRIWSSFHFLPGDLNASVEKRSKKYLNRYRLICNPNGDLLVDTINLARKGGMESKGLAMHVLADTWAHRYFAGTPSFVINDAGYFFEIIDTEDGTEEIAIEFKHNPVAPDDPVKHIYTASIRQESEYSIMNLGHGRAGHLPDYSYIKYSFLPAWGGYEKIVKDNPSDYYHAFCQMVYALKVLRNSGEVFEKDRYDEEAVKPYKERIMEILTRRQLLASNDWKEFGSFLSGREIEDFDIKKYQMEYTQAGEKDKNDTFLGRFFIAALAQKSMVTNKIFMSGNLLAGYSADYRSKGFKGIRDYKKLVEFRYRERINEYGKNKKNN
ncbi:MAG: hypothetical protein K6B28_01185 [Lachnospiraceae bacterium]|nr:hypothetical protein [Lachnospiraceae bacterium]